MASELKKAEAGRYLSFMLGKEIYAVPIQSVSEIIGITEITDVPNTPDFVKGVLNLRGRVIPVVDLRLKFHMNEVSYTRETCVIVMDTWSRQIGVIVDTVREVIDFVREQIEPTPELGDRIKTKFIMGMGKQEAKVVILVDINAVLSPDEMRAMGELPQVA